MIRTVLWTVVVVVLAAPAVLSLPVTNPTAQDDSKVMKCIVEVISDTVSKPDPLPLSQECLEVLQGDERILSILRHQNLLKELQEIAIQGASERTEEQKKNSGFEDELSEVLESQSNKNAERDLLEGTPEEEPTASFSELEAEKSQKNREKDVSREDERNSLEERDPRAGDVYPEDEKENSEDFKSNEVSKREELPWDEALDNHIHDDIREDEIRGQRQQDDDKSEGKDDGEEFEDEKEHISKNSQEEENEEREDREREQAEDEDEDVDEEEEEEERGTSEEEHPTSTENEDYQREDENEGSKSLEVDKRPSEEKDKEKSHNVKGGSHHSLDETTQAEDTSRAREVESEELDEEPSKDVEDAKRWNKMDELAKQLTTAKRTEENESNEDPDRSMKLASKYDIRNPEEDVRRAPKHHSKEESSEGGFPLVALPEEKKDEEGSANRRTEDQELESLAAIEAVLEKVAHKIHALRKA